MTTTDPVATNDPADKSILIVEDDNDFADSVKETLEINDYTVTVVNSSGEAIEHIHTHDPQLALIDLRLGQDDGVELIGKLKGIKPAIVCVIVTAYQSIDTTIEALRKGAYDYIAKPFHPEMLLSTLDRCFEKISLEKSHQNMVLELREHKDKLEKLVSSRTLELEHSNKELEAFCYSVSHDLRSPLRAIAGYSAILNEELESVINEGSRNLLSRIQFNIQYMGQLIDDLLQLSRISREDLKLHEFDLSKLVTKISETLLADESNHNLDFSIEPDIKAIGDANLISIALSNLIGNAFKFTRPKDQPKMEFGEITINGDKVYYFRDNGIGFDMRYTDKLFTAFSRLHNKDEFEGTGIGLATVHRIIQKHGGRIWAESKPDQGATFYFTLG